MVTWARFCLKQMWQMTKAMVEMKREQWTARRNWSSCTKFLLSGSWTHDLIARSVRASEQNSVVVGSNSIQVNFLLHVYLYIYLSISVSISISIYVSIYIYTYLPIYIYIYIYIYVCNMQYINIYILYICYIYYVYIYIYIYIYIIYI